MVKKRILKAALLSSLLLAACEAGETAEEPAETEEPDSGAEDTNEIDDQSEGSEDETPVETEPEEEPEEETEYLYEVSENYATINVIEETEANERVALLTYDDAPDDHALEIAEILIEHDAPAIFFVNGMYLEDEKGQEVLKELHNMGFEIGNHTHTHASLPSISEEEQYDEIIKTSDLVEEITGERPRFFRAPFGSNTEYSTQVAYDDGMMLMNWTYGYDWEADYQNPEALADIMVNTELLIPGANLLMHDREWTMEATPEIIEGLRQKDYEILDPALIRSVEEEDVAEITESEDDNE